MSNLQRSALGCVAARAKQANCTFVCFEYPRAKPFRGSRHVRWCAATYLLNMMFYPVTAGPGPGRYGLPPTIGFVGHDYTKSTSPAYSFHGRMTDTSTFFSYFAFKLTGRQNINKNACWFWQMAKNNTHYLHINYRWKAIGIVIPPLLCTLLEGCQICNTMPHI